MAPRLNPMQLPAAPQYVRLLSGSTQDPLHATCEEGQLTVHAPPLHT